MDRLASLLQRFAVSARLFHSGPLCGVNDFTPQEGLGQLHLVRHGPLRVEHLRESPVQVVEPSLLFYPRPLWHRFHSDAETGAEMACAHIALGDPAISPLAQALPAFLCLPLRQLDGSAALLDLLFDEAFAQRCGRQVVVDHLFAVVLVKILRHLMSTRALDSGLLAGLGHPQLAQALVAMHGEPKAAWSLERLAECAGMSRSVFAREFHRVLGQPPGDYLMAWRLLLAQQALQRGENLKRIAADIGYANEAALSRAFKSRHGVSPRAWLKARQAA
jgi:AraC-like DNA-binding protein